MSSTSKSIAAAAALVVLVLSGFWYALRETSSAPSVGASIDGAVATAAELPRPVDAAASHDRRGSRRAEPTAAEATDADTAATAKRQTSRTAARVTGRVLDGLGMPLPASTVRVDFRGASHLADKDGRFAVDVDPPLGDRQTTFEFRAPGRALRVLSKHLVAGVGVDLGDVKLAEGGSVSGRVVDEVGIPVGGASIVVASVPVEDVDAPKPARPAYPGLPQEPDETPFQEFSDPTPRGPAFAATADGAFTLTGLPVGEPTLLRFFAPGHRNGSTRVTARADVPVEGLRIVLPRQRDDEGVEGTVLAPDGSPAPDFEFEVEFEGGSGMGSIVARTDEKGCFRLETDKGMTFRLRVCDEARGWTSEQVGPLSPGSRNVKVETHAVRRIEIMPRGADGTAVTEFKFRLKPETAPANDGSGDFLIDMFFEEATPNRPARPLAPQGPFSVTVEAEGYATATLTHLDATKSGDRIVVPLTRLPAYVGVVRSPAGIVAGAAVGLFNASMAGKMVQAGFPLTRGWQPVARATTDASGRFTVTLREPGCYVVRAEAPGFVPGEAEVSLSAIEGGELPPVDLTKGGAIEGNVRTGGTRSAQGLFVCASRGDGAIRSAALANDGRFRIEGLMPGPWLLRVVDAVPQMESAIATIAEVAAPIEWTCTVAANEATHHDLGYGTGAACTVRGTLTAVGDRKWSVGLDYPSVSRGPTGVEPVPVAADGTYALSTDRTGDYWLAFMDTGGRVRVRLPVRLVQGEVRVDFALPTGSIEVVPRPGDTEPSYSLVWEGERGAFALLSLREVKGRLVAPVVPAGHVRVVHLAKDSKEEDPRRWSVDAQADVPAGGTKVVELR